ncbi:response regulator [Candidatus Daviesbacteria bacterium]|nr:response regulator [Candidatus Daviesbacteria bacterium]
MKKILICDDDEGIVEILTTILKEDRWEIKSITSGKKILKIIKDFMPDLVLLDIWMPGIGGVEITRLVKKDARVKHIPIIILSALQDTEEIAKEAGADGFILKPFEMEELLSKLNKQLLS